MKNKMEENTKPRSLPWWTPPNRTELYNEIMKDANDENIMQKLKQMEDIRKQDWQKEEKAIHDYFEKKKSDWKITCQLKFVRDAQWALGIMLGFILLCIVMAVLTSPSVCAIGCS